MRLFYDVDLQKFIVGPNTTQEVTSISAKRSPNFPLEIQFYHSNNPTPIELPSGATGTFEIKPQNRFDVNALTMASSWTKTGTGSSALYTFDLDLQNAALDGLLGAQEPTTISGVNTGTEVITTAADHGLVDGARVQFVTDGDLPAPLELATDYWVIASGLTNDDFKVSLTEGGAAIDLTDGGSGTSKVARVDDDEVSVNLMAAMQYIASGRTNESPNLTFVYQNDICRDDDTGTPPAAEDTVLNARVGREEITSGVDYQDFTFDDDFDLGAVVAVVGNVAMPDGSADRIIGYVRDDLVTETGFRVEFSATIPAAGYFYHYHAFQV